MGPRYPMQGIQIMGRMDITLIDTQLKQNSWFPLLFTSYDDGMQPKGFALCIYVCTSVCIKIITWSGFALKITSQYMCIVEKLFMLYTYIFGPQFQSFLCWLQIAFLLSCKLMSRLLSVGLRELCSEMFY